MKHRAIIIFQITLFYLLLHIPSGTYSDMLTATASAESKTLIYSWNCNAGPLNPRGYSPNQMYAQAMIYEPLVRYGEHGEILPCLAESWDMSPDGKEYVFHLRKNVFFSDGQPFNAIAVKMNHDAITRFAKNHAWLELVRQLKDTVIIDDHTVKLVLKESYYPVLENLTLVRPFRYMSPSAFSDNEKKDAITAPVGTGPWKLLESKLGEYDIFVRNEAYWGEKPDIEKIVVKVISDANTRAVAFETGEIDLIYGDDQINLDTFDRIRSDHRYVTQVAKILSTRVIALNSGQGHTKSIDVRRAILHAVDKDAIVKGILLNTEPRADTLFESHVPYCGLNLVPYGYDPQKSMAILEAAGWKKPGGRPFFEKDGAPLSVNLYFIGDNVVQKSISEVIQSYLRMVGIKVELKGVEEDMYYRKRKSGEFDMIFNDTWGPPYEPHAFCSAMRSPSSADFKAQSGLAMKEEIKDKISRAIISVDKEERKELYRYILTTLHEQAIYLPISHTTGLLAHTPALKGLNYGPTKYEVPFENIRKD